MSRDNIELDIQIYRAKSDRKGRKACTYRLNCIKYLTHEDSNVAASFALTASICII